MKCEHCHSASATCVVNVTLQGIPKGLFVCEDCAKAIAAQHPDAVRSSLQDLLKSIDAPGAHGKPAKPAKKPGKKADAAPCGEGPADDSFMSRILSLGAGDGVTDEDGPVFTVLPGCCPQCGASAESIRASLRFGCPHCYQQFPEIVAEFKREYQYDDIHVGRVPGTPSAAMRLVSMQKALRRAVESSDFATAARLRDEIRQVAAGKPTPSKDDTHARTEAIPPAGLAVPWIRALRFGSIVRYARVRLARNIENLRFPEQLPPGMRSQLCTAIIDALRTIPLLESWDFYMAESMGEDELRMFAEDNIISYDVVAHPQGAGWLVSPEGDTVVLVNEEDHIRIVSLGRDGDLRRCLRVVQAIDRQIERVVPYAFSRKCGYLTACPTNMGTGMRAGYMMNLLGIVINDEGDKALRALDRLGLAVRGHSGEGSDFAGHLYQISNQQTLGESEEAIVDRLERIVSQTARLEDNARQRLLKQNFILLKDALVRAVTLLQAVPLLSSDELLDYLSVLRFARERNLVKGISAKEIADFETDFLPGHMSITIAKSKKLPFGMLLSELVTDLERDQLRAETIQPLLKRLELDL